MAEDLPQQWKKAIVVPVCKVDISPFKALLLRDGPPV